MRYKHYVLKYPNGSLVGIDQSSGGYPWEAWKPNENHSLHGVAMWPFTDKGKEEALKYAGADQFALAVLEFGVYSV